jgi:hypothetical protein
MLCRGSILDQTTKKAETALLHSLQMMALLLDRRFEEGFALRALRSFINLSAGRRREFGQEIDD